MSAQIILKEGREGAVLRGHPWVFSGAIKSINGKPKEGDWIEALSASGHYLCSGHFGEQSIALRIISRNQKLNENESIQNKIQQAFFLRKILAITESAETNCYRLVNAEGDGLSGLVIDIYNKSAVIQVHSIGMMKNTKEIVSTLTSFLTLESIYLKDSTGEEVEESRFMLGDKSESEIKENNISYLVDIVRGQKTGFFLDQRDNRELLKDFSKDRNVLNCFAYTGGFSLAALSGGAKFVTSVDISSNALELLERNVSLNGFTNSSSIKADCFKYVADTNENYDLIILDPPSLAKHRGATKQAMKAYSSLNLSAFNKIEKNGFVFTFSCSQFVSRQEFESSVMDAAIKSNREVQILKTLNAAPCHVRSIFHPEAEYLKGLVLLVK